MTSRELPSFIKRPSLYIIAGPNAEDRHIAETVAAEMRDLTEPECLTLQEAKTRFPQRILPGMSLAILSKDVLADPQYAADLCRFLARSHRSSFFRHYCLSRGLELETLRAVPDLAPMFESVMVRDRETHLQALIAEMRDFVSRVIPNSPAAATLIGDNWKIGIGLWTGIAASHVSRLLLTVSRLSYLIGLALAAMWWRGWLPHWAAWLVYVSAWSAGYILADVHPADLWPWLGRRWQITNAVSPKPLPLAGVGPISIIAASLVGQSGFEGGGPPWFWAAVIVQLSIDIAVMTRFRRRIRIATAASAALAKLGSAGVDVAACSWAIYWQTVVHRTLMLIFAGLRQLLSVAVRIVPAYLAASALWPAATAGPAALLLCGVAASGFIVSVLLDAALRLSINLTLSAMALTAEQMRGMAPFIDRKLAVRNAEAALGVKPEELLRFSPDERPRVLHWLRMIRLCLDGRRLAQRWIKPVPYVFISYAWQDDPQFGISTQVAASCAEAGIGHFLDKTGVESQEGLFRVSVAAGIARCTHMVLAVSPHVSDARVVAREIETAMQRWLFEMSPAIVCVADRDVADALCGDPAVPLVLRFLLTFCPRMTPAEAANPALLRYAVEFTMRQARLGDWLLFLSPATFSLQTARMPGIAALGEAS